MHLSELRGRRVVSRASAETLGDVTDLLLSVEPAAVTALQIGKHRKARVIPWGQIVGIGPDAVVITDEQAAIPPRTPRAAPPSEGSRSASWATHPARSPTSSSTRHRRPCTRWKRTPRAWRAIGSWRTALTRSSSPPGKKPPNQKVNRPDRGNHRDLPGPVRELPRRDSNL